LNYYEHHIGDYAEATAHLSLLEDAVYSRMLRKYYATEKPLPPDVKRVQRLVGARTKDELAAVDAVLDEFFDLQEDGYHNARCDRDIAAFNDGQPDRDLKKKNEANRLKRHRDERANLFQALTDAGGHADWNIKMADLRELVKRVAGDKKPFQINGKSPPATPPATAPATPATATQTPDTRHQTPVINQGAFVEHQQDGPDGPARAFFGPEQPEPGSWSGPAVQAVAQAMRAAGLPGVSDSSPKLQALLSAGLTPAELLDAAAYAVARGHGFAYAMARAEGQRRDAAALAALPSAPPAEPAVDPDSRAGIEASALALGLSGWDQATEQWPQFAARVRRARGDAQAVPAPGLGELLAMRAGVAS